MCYTDEEIGLIDGLILSYFTPISVSESVRMQYLETHQHIEENQIEYSDLMNIKAALSFLSSIFQSDRNMEKAMISVLAKTIALLRAAY